MKNSSSRLRAGILLTMAIATIFGVAVCFGGVAFGIADYLSYEDVAPSARLSQAKALMLHLLEFIVPSLGMYLSVMVLLTWWYYSLRPSQSPTGQASLERLADRS
jgi:hypothetical protein